MEVLRALFGLAVCSRKENISVQNVGQQARQAILQIASTSTALFMTTLTLDILNPKSLEHRKIMMQVVAFLIRKVCIADTTSHNPTINSHTEAITIIFKPPAPDGSGSEVFGP